ncbi:MAG: beta-galactosidase, partial [Bryobacteraceae bacterium]
MSRIVIIGCAMAAALTAGELVLPSPVLSRDGIVTVTYRMGWQVTGSGTFSVRWTDSLRRVVEERSEPVRLNDEAEFSFPLDLRRAVAMKNTLHVHLSLPDARDMKRDLGHKEDDAEAEFVAQVPGKRWTDYVIIMWQQYRANLIPAVEKLGINGGEYSGRSHSLPDSFIDNNMRWYSENIGTDYYSEYHRYRPDRIQNWSFLQAKALYAKDPSSLEAFKRHPSFWDPVWRKKIHDRLVDAAKRNKPYRPFFYSLADESGIADLAGFWDFDFSDESLVPMRRWLQEQYGSLAALNQEWGTNFTAWDLVTPTTTHRAMQRTDGNFAAWADFKEWMDISYADALRMGREAIEEVDPDAYVGVGGGQMPGWGGYDYSRITESLTEIEPYDIGNNIEIIRSLNPAMPMLTTGFASGDWEKQRVWHELFHGNRGLIIWDEKHAYVGEDGQPGPRG